MAYNNGFPMSYQQYYPQYPQYQQYYSQQNTQQNSDIKWVQGEAGAKSYLVAPNNTVQLWDSESQTIYLKSADASGMPSMRILDYTIRDSTPQPIKAVSEPSSGVTRAEFDEMKKQIAELRQKVEKEVEE